jgi:hypothetical protein
MRKQNCWEYKQCGREPGGENAGTLGVCPAASARHAHGSNGGRNGGRACWAIAGTFCRKEASGTYAVQLLDCMECGFFRLVGEEEGRDYMGAKSIFARIHMHSPASSRRSPGRRTRRVRE